MNKNVLFTLFTVVFLFHFSNSAFAQAVVTTEFGITIENVRPPTECGHSGWMISYDRITTLGEYRTPDLTRYFVQYVNGDLNLVHYWGSGYAEYVQDYWVGSGYEWPVERAGGGYEVPLWMDTYDAESIEYILSGYEVIWEVRAALTCEAGTVVAYALTSEPVHRTRDSLPEPTRNLVLALDDIALYGEPYTQTHSRGSIRACQTFFISNIRMPRSSISIWARESITEHDILLYDGRWLPIVDVAENYGQPDGQPIVDECVGS